jgi:hypothetical protein
MNIRMSRVALVLGLLVSGTGAAACAPAPTATVDIMGSAVAEVANSLLTQTAAAASPTPPPSTPTPIASPTEPPTATSTSGDPPRRPQTVTFASCGLGGPEPQYEHETSINKGKGVELLGIGSIQGWYVIRDPYFHRPCWIQATDLKIFPGTDLTSYPVMTPGVPAMGQ